MKIKFKTLLLKKNVFKTIHMRILYHFKFHRLNKTLFEIESLALPRYNSR